MESEFAAVTIILDYSNSSYHNILNCDNGKNGDVEIGKEFELVIVLVFEC